jgi:hypothetical protein
MFFYSKFIKLLSATFAVIFVVSLTVAGDIKIVKHNLFKPVVQENGEVVLNKIQFINRERNNFDQVTYTSELFVQTKEPNEFSLASIQNASHGLIENGNRISESSFSDSIQMQISKDKFLELRANSEGVLVFKGESEPISLFYLLEAIGLDEESERSLNAMLGVHFDPNRTKFLLHSWSKDTTELMILAWDKKMNQLQCFSVIWNTVGADTIVNKLQQLSLIKDAKVALPLKIRIENVPVVRGEDVVVNVPNQQLEFYTCQLDSKLDNKAALQNATLTRVFENGRLLYTKGNVKKLDAGVVANHHGCSLIALGIDYKDGVEVEAWIDTLAYLTINQSGQLVLRRAEIIGKYLNRNVRNDLNAGTQDPTLTAEEVSVLEKEDLTFLEILKGKVGSNIHLNSKIHELSQVHFIPEETTIHILGNADQNIEVYIFTLDAHQNCRFYTILITLDEWNEIVHKVHNHMELDLDVSFMKLFPEFEQKKVCKLSSSNPNPNQKIDRYYTYSSFGSPSCLGYITSVLTSVNHEDADGNMVQIGPESKTVQFNNNGIIFHGLALTGFAPGGVPQHMQQPSEVFLSGRSLGLFLWISPNGKLLICHSPNYVKAARATAQTSGARVERDVILSDCQKPENQHNFFSVFAPSVKPVYDKLRLILLAGMSKDSPIKALPNELIMKIIAAFLYDLDNKDYFNNYLEFDKLSKKSLNPNDSHIVIRKKDFEQVVELGLVNYSQNSNADPDFFVVCFDEGTWSSVIEGAKKYFKL